jgi:hypothetical protein
MLAAFRLSQRAVTSPLLGLGRSQIRNPFSSMASLLPAAGASPKRLRVYSSSAAADGGSLNGAGSGKRVGTHNGSFHCDEALGCYLIRLTSQFAGADVIRTRDSQVPPSLCSICQTFLYSTPSLSAFRMFILTQMALSW